MRRAALLASLLTACGGSSEGVLARFVSDRAIPDEADTLEVVVRASDTGSELERQTYPLSAIDAFPATLELVPGAATPMQIRVDGYLRYRDDVIAAGTADAAFADGEQVGVDVQLVDVAFVRASSSSGSSGQASLSIDAPSGVVAGDLLVAMIAHDAGMTFFIPAPAGWTYESSLTANVDYGARVYVFWKIAGPSEPMTSFTPMPAYSGEMIGGVWAIGGADPASPIDLSSVQAHTGAATSCVAPSITLLRPSLTLFACAENNALTMFTPPASMTEDWDVGSKPEYAMVTEGAHEVRLGGPTADRSADTTAINDGHVGLQLAIAGSR